MVTDDLGAAAITDAFGFDEAIALAIDAGIDLLLVANQQDYDPRVVTKIVDLVERLIGEGRLTNRGSTRPSRGSSASFPSVAAAAG